MFSYFQPSGQVHSDTGRRVELALVFSSTWALNGTLSFFKDGLQMMVIYNWRAESVHLGVCLPVMGCNGAGHPSWLAGGLYWIVLKVQGGFAYWLNILYG